MKIRKILKNKRHRFFSVDLLRTVFSLRTADSLIVYFKILTHYKDVIYRTVNFVTWHRLAQPESLTKFKPLFSSIWEAQPTPVLPVMCVGPPGRRTISTRQKAIKYTAVYKNVWLIYIQIKQHVHFLLRINYKTWFVYTQNKRSKLLSIIYWVFNTEGILSVKSGMIIIRIQTHLFLSPNFMCSYHVSLSYVSSTLLDMNVFIWHWINRNSIINWQTLSTELETNEVRNLCDDENMKIITQSLEISLREQSAGL